jgi:hypothetical protein
MKAAKTNEAPRSQAFYDELGEARRKRGSGRQRPGSRYGYGGF